MSRYRQTMESALREVYKLNEKDHEVSMARGELEAIADKATQLASMLQSKSDEGNPLEAWVQSKITKAKDYINSVSDYMTYNPDMKQNEEKEEVKLDEFTSDMIKRLQKSYSTMPQKISPEQATALSKHLDRLDLVSLKQLVKANIPFVSTVAKNKVYKKTGKFEEVELVEKTYGWTLVSKAKDLAKKFANNMSKAVDEIEKLEKGLSKNPSVEQELRKYNEEIERPNPANPNPNKDLDEGIMKDIYSMDQDGASVEEIAKKLKMNLATVKKILGEELTEEDEKASDSNKEKDVEAMEKQMVALQGQVNLLKQKLENEKNKTIKPVPNKETGEVSLTFGIANKLLKDKAKKEEEKKPVEDVAESSTLKNSFKEERRLYVEAIAGLQKKADKSGMSYSILKKVYDRGMAAWKGGHRPGASQHQWAFARVNSFITKSSGTWGGADKDLAKQVKG
jgi:hypothetical protein